ncbi:MAG: T9SS type A sorting domain-containing protein [Bacteroidaceae bacterium]|nr:T9SS type A sorting domain-containing protein [Bacteroidaceae bacterium]
MKKLFMLLAFLAGTIAAHAGDYAYLTFQTTDGAKFSVPASSLTITLSGTTLTAGSQTFELTNLSKMYFSDDNQSTDVSTLTADQLDGTSEIYDLNGRKVSTANLPKGVYIVKSKNGTCKIAQK